MSIYTRYNDNSSLKMYRLTRDSQYSIGTLGYSDISARFAYFYLTITPEQAIGIMRRDFPGETFTCDISQG